MAKNRKLATDHRALVLESVATSPETATIEVIRKDCSGPAFKQSNVDSMVWQLRKEGLIGRREDGGHFLTTAGLDWLAHGWFDRQLPAKHERPRARKPRGPGGRRTPG